MLEERLHLINNLPEVKDGQNDLEQCQTGQSGPNLVEQPFSRSLGAEFGSLENINSPFESEYHFAFHPT